MIDLRTLTLEEKRAFQEFERRMASVLEDGMLEDLTLYRFLKARDFVVDEAEKMLRKHLIWRKVNQVDTILEEFQPKEFFRRYIEPTVLGVDKVGDVVWYTPFGKMEGKDIVKCEKLHEYLRHWIWLAERQREMVVRLADNDRQTLPQLCVILDLDSLTLGNATNKASTEECIGLLHILQDNYPEGLKSLYVINAPGYFVFIFSLLKAMMSHAMLQKIFVFGSGGWKEKFPDVINADVLPAFLGGNRTDPDGNPLCKTFVNHAGKIDPRYFLSPGDRYFADKSRVEELVVPKSGKREVHVEVCDGQSQIQWEFFVRGGDVGFGMLHDGATEVLPLQRYHTSDGTRKGSYRVRSLGKYVLVFDNSFSWLNSKEVEYCVDVV